MKNKLVRIGLRCSVFSHMLVSTEPSRHPVWLHGGCLWRNDTQHHWVISQMMLNGPACTSGEEWCVSMRERPGNRANGMQDVRSDSGLIIVTNRWIEGNRCCLLPSCLPLPITRQEVCLYKTRECFNFPFLLWKKIDFDLIFFFFYIYLAKYMW